MSELKDPYLSLCSTPFVDYCSLVGFSCWEFMSSLYMRVKWLNRGHPHHSSQPNDHPEHHHTQKTSIIPHRILPQNPLLETQLLKSQNMSVLRLGPLQSSLASLVHSLSSHLHKILHDSLCHCHANPLNSLLQIWLPGRSKGE